MKVKWIGDEKILPEGAEVTILATDPDDPDARFGRGACWIKWLLDGFDAPMYRSCNMDDLEITGEDSEVEALLSTKTVSVATHEYDRVVPQRSYDGTYVRQLQPDGSWKIIGPDTPLRQPASIIEEVRRHARSIAGDTAAIRKSLTRLLVPVDIPSTTEPYVMSKDGMTEADMVHPYVLGNQGLGT